MPVYLLWSSADYLVTFKSIQVSAHYPDVVSTVDLTAHEGFFVWANWGSGDSFGHASGKHYESLAVFAKYDDAKDFVEWLDKITSDASGKPFDMHGGVYHKYGQLISLPSLSWTGYFDHNPTFNIERVGPIK